MTNIKKISNKLFVINRLNVGARVDYVVLTRNVPRFGKENKKFFTVRKTIKIQQNLPRH